ncbi:hypothetical protein MASR2M29_01380 [Spirochaetota bacterium]
MERFLSPLPKKGSCAKFFIHRICICLACLVLLFSCASSPASTEQAIQLYDVELRLSGLAVKAISIQKVGVKASLLVSNSGEADIHGIQLAFRCVYWHDGMASVLYKGKTADSDAGLLIEKLPAGASVLANIGFELDIPEGTEAMIPVNLEAEISYSANGTLPGKKQLVLPLELLRIIPPALMVKRILIVKDELINTKLRLDLGVENPNAFPLSFDKLEYRLYGEGRYWASGSIADSFLVPAMGTTDASLFLTMNFGDMNRSLLDQIIKLASVAYRLEGMGKIGTGLDFLPEFALPFELSGKTVVIR